MAATIAVNVDPALLLQGMLEEILQVLHRVLKPESELVARMFAFKIR